MINPPYDRNPQGLPLMSTPLRYLLIALLIVAPLAGHADATLIYQSPDPEGATDAVY